MTGKSDDYIHQKYITDCVKENKVLDMEDYRQVSVKSNAAGFEKGQDETCVNKCHFYVQH